MEVKPEYEKLVKKYGLPRYDSLNSEFELLYINEIAEVSYVLRFVRRRINDKIAWACNMIQSLLQPNPGSLINLQESNFLNGDDKKKMSTILKDLMQHERTSLLLDLDNNEKADAEYIKTSFNKWLKVKPELISITKKLKGGWERAEETKESRPAKDHYFG